MFRIRKDKLSPSAPLPSNTKTNPKNQINPKTNPKRPTRKKMRGETKGTRRRTIEGTTRIKTRKEKGKRSTITVRGRSIGKGTPTPMTAGKMSTTGAKDEVNDGMAVRMFILEGV